MKKYLVLLAFLGFAITGVAQTNAYYGTGDLTLSLAPTVSFPMSAGKQVHALYGYEYTSLYWQTAHTGTGLVVGKRDFAEANLGFIDHITVIEAFRITPVANQSILGRLSLSLFTGAETWFDDGTKGIQLGAGSEWAFTRNIRGFLNASEHFESTAEKSGGELSGGLSWRF